MQSNDKLNANDLMDIMSRQMKALDELDLNNKNALKEVSRAKEIFNGAGKIIKLAEFAKLQNQSGAKGNLLLPE